MRRHNTLYQPCILQEDDDCSGTVHLEATETEDGLDLHELYLPGTAAEDPIFWGRLSLAGWEVLCQLLALRHPARFARVVTKWQALKDARPQEEPPHAL